MRIIGKSFTVAIIATLFGLGAIAQNQPDPYANAPIDAPPESAPIETPTIAPEPANPEPLTPPATREVQIADPNNYSPEPDLVWDTQVPQDEYSPQIVKAPKRPSLSDGNPQDEYTVQWDPQETQNQAIIAQTQHRKHEIDPAKRVNLVELSRVFGALHALRIACEGQADQTYRARMTAMLDMEAPSADFIRDPLIAAFNQGFSSGGSGQTPCPNDKDTKEAFLAKNGFRLANLMAQFYRKDDVKETTKEKQPT